MLFDPLYFIRICDESGLRLSREAGMIRYSYEGRQINELDCFIEAIKAHKKELLPFLSGIYQLDLLEEFNID
ncbi:hypothetical protein [Methylicorpusculum sp.]|uniref:hypothetical protein n=1 Tax=Methylicorpusculum sp. TaxID=2713644 RepID=UPI002ABB1942|nr:hypothetical protein [Methylicorpusculum sp.]MDZ4154421.1 hypothetical protein [Methylicorpusculum sp.]